MKTATNLYADVFHAQSTAWAFQNLPKQKSIYLNNCGILKNSLAWFVGLFENERLIFFFFSF